MSELLPAEERLRYWAEHPAGQAEPLRTDLIAAADELERLERERSEWAGVAATRNRNIALIADERDAAVKALAELRADAVETVQHWGGYVSDYFKEKHDLAGDIERLKGTSTRSVTTKGEGN